MEEDVSCETRGGFFLRLLVNRALSEIAMNFKMDCLSESRV